MTIAAPFCGGARSAVRFLIDGPRLFICDACVGACTALLPKDDVRGGAGRLSPGGFCSAEFSSKTCSMPWGGQGHNQAAARFLPLRNSRLNTRRRQRASRVWL